MSHFPANVIDLLSGAVVEVPGVNEVVGRPIRLSDGDALVGIYPGMWSPQEYEIGVVSTEPTIQNYTLNLQFATAQGGEESLIRADHAETSRRIRAMLYRNGDLGLALRQLSETLDGVTERYARMEVVQQLFFSNNLQGVFRFLSHLDLRVQTTT